MTVIQKVYLPFCVTSGGGELLSYVLTARMQGRDNRGNGERVEGGGPWVWCRRASIFGA